MANTTKCAVSLPRNLFARMESVRRRTRENRSAFVRRAVETLFEKADEAEKVRAYVEGYRRHPETKREIQAADSAGAAFLATEPWD